MRFGNQNNQSFEDDSSNFDTSAYGYPVAKDSGIDTGLSSSSNQTLNEDIHKNKVYSVVMVHIFAFVYSLFSNFSNNESTLVWLEDISV